MYNWTDSIKRGQPLALKDPFSLSFPFEESSEKQDYITKDSPERSNRNSLDRTKNVPDRPKGTSLDRSKRVPDRQGGEEKTICYCRLSYVVKSVLFLCLLIGATTGLLFWIVNNLSGESIENIKIS